MGKPSSFALVLMCNRSSSPAFLAWLLPLAWFVVAVVCMATYAWLLTAAARMPGMARPVEPPA